MYSKECAYLKKEPTRFSFLFLAGSEVGKVWQSDSKSISKNKLEKENQEIEAEELILPDI
jgi:hypothetical protein